VQEISAGQKVVDQDLKLVVRVGAAPLWQGNSQKRMNAGILRGFYWGGRRGLNPRHSVPQRSFSVLETCHPDQGIFFAASTGTIHLRVRFANTSASNPGVTE
jgi:hypothetical protein